MILDTSDTFFLSLWNLRLPPNPTNTFLWRVWHRPHDSCCRAEAAVSGSRCVRAPLSPVESSDTFGVRRHSLSQPLSPLHRHAAPVNFSGDFLLLKVSLSFSTSRRLFNSCASHSAPRRLYAVFSCLSSASMLFFLGLSTCGYCGF